MPTTETNSLPTQADFDALVNSPSFKKKLKDAQAKLAQPKAATKTAAAKKFNLCDSYESVKPYLLLAMPLLGLIDKKISKTIQQFIAGADAGCAVK